MLHWCKVSRPYLLPVQNYWNWTIATLKKWFFWSNLHGQILLTWPHTQYNLSHLIKFCWWRQGQKLWCHKLYFKIPFLRRSRATIFADIIKIVTIFIKTIFKDSEQVPRISNDVSKLQSISWYSEICWIPAKKCWCQQKSSVVSRYPCMFEFSLGKVKL